MFCYLCNYINNKKLKKNFYCEKCINNPARNPCIKPSEPNDIDFQCHCLDDLIVSGHGFQKSVLVFLQHLQL